MTDAELHALYDRLYFHEIEMREKLTGRVQAPLTFIITLAGIFAFLAQRYELDALRFTASHTIFIFFVLVALASLAFATYNLCQAWLSNEYKFIPFAEETARYREELERTYAPFPDSGAHVERYMREYLVREYVSSSTLNARVNDRRSNSIDRANQQIALSAAMLLIAFLAFQFGDLDSSRIRKPQEVTITKPVDVKVQR